jgi:hypothetical protein
MTTVDFSLMTITGMQIGVAIYGYIETKHKSQAVIVALGALLICLTVARIAI